MPWADAHVIVQAVDAGGTLLAQPPSRKFVYMFAAIWPMPTWVARTIVTFDFADANAV